MLAETRRKRILHELDDRTAVQVQELADLLGVTPMTIRRDLDDLEAQGLLRRIHGGAESTAASREPTFASKMDLHPAEKEAIAAAAASMVRPDQALAFSAGSTCTRIAQYLAAHRPPGEQWPSRTVVTNSLSVADEFFRAGTGGTRGPRVLLTGGERTPSDAMVGPLADAALAALHVDLLFLGAHGAGPEGLTTPNVEEARTNQALIRSARRVVAVLDHSKWGARGLAGFASWSEIDTLVTTPGIPEQSLAEIREHVREVVVAP